MTYFLRPRRRPASRRAVAYADGSTGAPKTCEFASARIRMYYQHVEWDVDVRAVHPPPRAGSRASKRRATTPRAAEQRGRRRDNRPDRGPDAPAVFRSDRCADGRALGDAEHLAMPSRPSSHGRARPCRRRRLRRCRRAYRQACRPIRCRRRARAPRRRRNVGADDAAEAHVDPTPAPSTPPTGVPTGVPTAAHERAVVLANGRANGCADGRADGRAECRAVARADRCADGRADADADPTVWDYKALLMRNSSCAGGNYSVHTFEQATARANEKLLGCNTGWCDTSTGTSACTATTRRRSTASARSFPTRRRVPRARLARAVVALGLDLDGRRRRLGRRVSHEVHVRVLQPRALDLSTTARSRAPVSAPGRTSDI